MKKISYLLWATCLFLVVYLGFALSDTGTMHWKDIEQIEAGNETTQQMWKVNTLHFQKEEFDYYTKILRSESRNEDDFLSKILYKILTINNIKNKSFKELESLQPQNPKNLKEIHSLLSDYTHEIKSLDTVLQKIGSLDSGRYQLLYSKNNVVQNAHFEVFKNDIQRFYEIAVQRCLYNRCILSIKFDKITALSISKSKIIEEGSDYEAYLLLVDISVKPYHVQATFDGKLLEVKDYIYPISFIANAEKFDVNGECRKKWQAKITVADAFKDTTYLIEKEYIIKRK
jgi:hypothetical protein